MFALVAGALTNEIIVLTTDNNIYSTEGITADSSIGALGMSYYAVKHLLLSSTPATQFKNLATDEAVESLRNGSIDVIIGPYATLIEARLRTIADDKERTTAVLRRLRGGDTVVQASPWKRCNSLPARFGADGCKGGQ